MAKRIVGLIGCGEGPKVFVGGAAVIEIKGAADGHYVQVRTFGDSEGYIAIHTTNGRASINCRFVQFTYGGPGKDLICNVHLEA